jgi:hypothetical protein
MAKTKDILVLYVILCLVGAILEWAYGTLWSLCGQAPWIYPNSIFRYTSLEGLPLWGLGGLICVTIYRTYSNRSWKIAMGIIPLLALAAIWVLIHGLVIQ